MLDTTDVGKVALHLKNEGSLYNPTTHEVAIPDIGGEGYTFFGILLAPLEAASVFQSRDAGDGASLDLTTYALETFAAPGTCARARFDWLYGDAFEIAERLGAQGGWEDADDYRIRI